MARIVIVDDSILMRRNLRQIFIKAGHEIVGECKNGLEICQKYTELKPDLVTMDITMPKMNGIESVEKIIKKHPDASIIIVSAVNQKRMVLEAMEKGARHYITKPINDEKVISVAKEVLEEIGKIDEEPNDKMPFKINNEDGIFKIEILEEIDKKILEELNVAVKGLLFVKPLKVEFNIENIELNTSPLRSEFFKLISKIRFVGGQVNFSSDTES